MRRLLGAALAAALWCGLVLSVRAREGDDKAAMAIVDKGIQALGGADKLAKATTATWKSKGKLNFGDAENPFSSAVTVQGLDNLRQEFEGEFGGNKVNGISVLHGDKAWRGFNGDNMELDKDGVADQKRTLYLLVAPTLLLPLKDKGFKVEAAPEEKIGDKMAAAIKVTGPDGKNFKLYFDKESGLPVKQVAKVAGFMGEEFVQETSFSNYKDFGGIKRATKVVNLRDGQKFLESEVIEFATLDKADPKLFAEPK